MLILFGCDNGNTVSNSSSISIPSTDFTNINQTIFAVEKNNLRKEYTWDAYIYITGFTDAIMNYSNSFTGPNYEYKTGYKENFTISISKNSPGVYTGNNSTDSLIYYDTDGNQYSTLFPHKDTKVEIKVTSWIESEIKGTFTGILYCPELDEYITMAGKFISFESSYEFLQ